MSTKIVNFAIVLIYNRNITVKNLEKRREMYIATRAHSECRETLSLLRFSWKIHKCIRNKSKPKPHCRSPIRTRQNGNSIELGRAGTLRGSKLDYSLTEIPEP